MYFPIMWVTHDRAIFLLLYYSILVGKKHTTKIYLLFVCICDTYLQL